MIQSKQNEQLVKMSNRLTRKLDKYEVILALIFLVILLLHISSDFQVGVFMTITLSTLAVLYFFKAYSMSDDDNAGGLERFIDKLASLSLSVCLIGIMFRLENWPGYDKMLLIGSSTLVIILPIILVMQSKKPDLKIFSQRMKLRIVIIAALGLLLYFTPADELIKVGIVKSYNTEVAK